MICDIINSIKIWTSCKENWQMIIIPILAPVATILGTYTLTIFKIQKDQKKKKSEFEQTLKNEEKEIFDSIDLLTLLVDQHLHSLNEMKENVSFHLLKNLTLSLFTNEPLVLLNQIPKNRLDLIFKRQQIIEQEKLLIYGNFLTSRQLALQLYTNLSTWFDTYRNKSEHLNMEFSYALLRLLNYLENETVNTRNDKTIKNLFTNFLNAHSDYSSSNRYKNESEVSMIDGQIDELVAQLKENKYYYELHDFQLHYLKIKSVITNIVTLSHNSKTFLQQTIKAIRVQVQKIKEFETSFYPK